VNYSIAALILAIPQHSDTLTDTRCNSGSVRNLQAHIGYTIRYLNPVNGPFRVCIAVTGKDVVSMVHVLGLIVLADR
jgi:hypothetical protein